MPTQDSQSGFSEQLDSFHNFGIYFQEETETLKTEFLNAIHANPEQQTEDSIQDILLSLSEKSKEQNDKVEEFLPGNEIRSEPDDYGMIIDARGELEASKAETDMDLAIAYYQLQKARECCIQYPESSEEINNLVEKYFQWQETTGSGVIELPEE